MIVISLGLFFVALTVSMFSLMTIENKNQEACFKRLDNSNFERYEYLKKRNIWFSKRYPNRPNIAGIKQALEYQRKIENRS